jgi:hypothetical protein
VTASPPGKTLNKASSTTIYEYKVLGGTTVSLQATPDPGSYFVGWQSQRAAAAGRTLIVFALSFRTSGGTRVFETCQR